MMSGQGEERSGEAGTVVWEERTRSWSGSRRFSVSLLEEGEDAALHCLQ